MDTIAIADLPAFGAPLGGGFYAGSSVTDDGQPCALIVPDKSIDNDPGMTWNEAMAYVSTLDIGGHTDWRLPNRVDQAVLWKFLAPNGTNTSEMFCEGGPQAFEKAAYWSSTDSSTNHAWGQNFVNGGQSGWGKGDNRRVRPIRHIIIR